MPMVPLRKSRRLWETVPPCNLKGGRGLNDDEFRALALGRDAMDDALWELDEDHRTQDIPAHTALFTRTYPAYTETMWVHAYPGARVIVVSYPSVAMRDVGRVTAMPGVIRTIPVSWRDMASAGTFRSKFECVVESLTRGGWVSKPHTVGQEGR